MIDKDLMNDIASYMNDEAREQLHSEMAPCNEIDFVRAYCEKDDKFYDLLKTEFPAIWKMI